MKKIYLRRTLFILCTLLGTLSVHAYDAKIDGICYNLDNNYKTATVTYGSAIYSGNISIPNEIEYNGTTYRVTEIGYRAFRDRKDLTSLNIPNSVGTILNNAFYFCI